MTTAQLKFHQALDLMRRRDARLIQTNIKDRCEYWIVPGGRIEPKVAEKIRTHPQVRAGKDGMFPGLDQTWRIGGE
jgi:hypothetical protein